MASKTVVMPMEVAVRWGALVMATRAHREQQQLHGREHPARRATKAAYLATHDAWKASVKFN